MKRSALLLLSSLLLNTASYAGNTKCDECYDLSTKNAAALHYTVSKPNSQESKYWDDYIYSGTKDITLYVRDLSRKDAQAALWFITTGGKYGFAAREATAEERVLLEEAIKQVAISYGNRSNTGRGLQEWSQVSNANHAGHLHLQMIYRQIDNLNFKVDNLNIRVTALEADLKAERKARENLKLAAVAEKTSYDKSAAEEVRLTALITQNLKDAEQKLAAQKLADKTAADALLETEKAKIQEEVNRQKGRKRHYKDQLADYKEKEAEARQAAAIAKAVKEQQEAAALKERQREEEVRKEREAWAKEKEIILAALAKSGHLPSGMNLKMAPPAPNSPTITINGANK